MPSEGENILQYNSGEKSLKLPWVIYADFECLLLRKQSCQNNPEESYTEKIHKSCGYYSCESIHESCGYSIDLFSSFDSKQDKNSYYRGKDCAKKFCEDLKKYAFKIINYKEKEVIPLTYNENRSYEK